jgi:hypothetical protein
MYIWGMAGICIGPVLVVVTVLGAWSPFTVVVVEIIRPMLLAPKVPDDVDVIIVA